jgi:hypothetical protein
LSRQREQGGDQAQPRGGQQLGFSDVDDFTFHCLSFFRFKRLAPDWFVCFSAFPNGGTHLLGDIPPQIRFYGWTDTFQVL